MKTAESFLLSAVFSFKRDKGRVFILHWQYLARFLLYFMLLKDNLLTYFNFIKT